MGTDFHLVDIAAQEALYIDRAGRFFEHSENPPERVMVADWGFARVVTPANVASANAELYSFPAPQPQHIMNQGFAMLRWVEERSAAVERGRVILVDDSSAKDEALNDQIHRMRESGEIRVRNFSEYYVDQEG